MGWWDQKLGNPAPQRQVPSPVHPDNLPRGMGVDHGRVIDRYMDQRTGVQQQVASPQEMAQGAYEPQLTERGEIATGDAIRTWKGNPQAGASETGLCPSCGSARFMSRSAGSVFNSKTGQQVNPFPECFECGYNGKYQQGALAVSAKATGAAAPSRQGAMPRFTSLADTMAAAQPLN